MPVVHVAPSAGERKINGSRQGEATCMFVDITVLTAEPLQVKPLVTNVLMVVTLPVETRGPWAAG